MTPAAHASLEELDDVLNQFCREKIFLVVDKQAYQQSGAAERLQSIFDRYQVRTFSDFEPNPKLHDVIQGAQQLGPDSQDIVVAIGGGTAIDVAKLICCACSRDRTQNAEQLKEHFADSSNLVPRCHPFVAIPTTAGTGSEATHFAVVYIENVKHSVAHASLLPDAVILDPSLTHSLPKGITAASGLDAVTQAIESMWSIRSTNKSIELADRALQLSLGNLESAVLAPTPSSRAAMLEAAHLAGQAINISRTTAPHALSYTMTIRHQIPHGMAVALSIGPFLRFNAQFDSDKLNDPRGPEHLSMIFERIASSFGVAIDQDNPMQHVAHRWEQLLRRLGCGTRLSDWGITDAKDREIIATSVNQQRLSNNPRLVTESDLIQLVESMV